MFSFCRFLFVLGASLSLQGAVLTINSDNYQTEVLESKIPVVLDAYTDWCHYCKGVAPLFSELSNEMKGKVKFVKLNIETQATVASGLHIEALPTFLFYKNGKIVDRQAGALDKEGFKSKFNELF